MPQRIWPLGGEQGDQGDGAAGFGRQEGTGEARRFYSSAIGGLGRCRGADGTRRIISSAPSLWVTEALLGNRGTASPVSLEADRCQEADKHEVVSSETSAADMGLGLKAVQNKEVSQQCSRRAQGEPVEVCGKLMAPLPALRSPERAMTMPSAISAARRAQESPGDLVS